MNESDLTVLSAFFDGERVDPATLAVLLDRAEAIVALRDFARLRAELGGGDSVPGAAWVAKTSLALAQRDRVPLWRRWVPVPVPVILAATVLVVAVTIAWTWTSASRTRVGPDATRPPVASRTLAFVDGEDWKRR